MRRNIDRTKEDDEENIRQHRGETADDDSDADADARRPSLEFVRGKRRAFISSERSKTPLFLLSKSIRGRSEQNVVGRRCSNGFLGCRMNERTIALMRLVELANGEEEEKEERAGGGGGEEGGGEEEKERTNGTEENEEEEEQGRFGRTELER